MHEAALRNEEQSWVCFVVRGLGQVAHRLLLSDVRPTPRARIGLVFCTQEGVGAYRSVWRDDSGYGSDGDGDECLQGEFTLYCL
jgi:hypothetical protein